MPITSGHQKNGPIEVVQDNEHFLVRIHPEDRDRAKRIAGRQWDGTRRTWVYPKDIPTYEALVAEFQKDADLFSIRRPKNKRPAGIKPPSIDDDEYEEKQLEDLNSLSDGQIKIQTELNQINKMLHSLKDIASIHDRHFEELQERHDENNKIIKQTIKQTKKSTKPDKIRALPNNLDLNKQNEVKLLDQTLRAIAYATSGQNEDLQNWLERYSPLQNPTDFVAYTHELLKESLEKLVLGQANSEVSFSNLVHKAQQDNIIYCHHHDTVKVFSILRSLNDVRNRFVHARGVFPQSEKWARSILYLMNLALIWKKIMMIEDSNA